MRPRSHGAAPRVSIGRRCACAALLVLCLVGCMSDAERAAEHKRRAERYLDEGRPLEAIIELRSALSFTPRDLDTHWRLGGAYLAAGLQREARFYLDDAHQMAPDNDEAAIRFADVLVDSDPSRAEWLLDEVLARNPDSPGAHVVRAELLLLRGEIADAEREARHAVRLAPDDPRAHWKLARIYESRMQTRRRTGRKVPPTLARDALTTFERLVELDPSRQPEALLGRANALFFASPDDIDPRVKAGYEQALEAAEQASGEPDLLAAAQATAEFARASADAELEARALEIVVEHAPYDLDAWEALASVREQQGSSAEDLLATLLERRHRSPDAHLVYARHLARTRGPEAAIAHLEEAIEAGVDPPQLLAAVAELQIDANDLEGMNATVKRMRDRYPRHWRTTAISAHQALARGEIEEAAEILRTLTERYEDPKLFERLAVIELKLGNYGKAIAEIRKAIRGTRGLPIEQNRLLAAIQHDAGDCEGAVRTLRYLERYGQLGVPDALRLARCRYRTGNRNAGREIFEDLLARPDPPVPVVVEFAAHEGLDPASHDRVREVLTAALERHPGQQDLVYQLASLDFSRRRFRAAADGLGPAIERNPTSVELRMLRAHARAAMGDHAGASNDAHVALMRDPGLTSGAVQLLVQLAVAGGQLDRSIENLERLVEAGRAPNGGLVLLGQLYARAGRNAEAIAAYDRALASAPHLAVVKNDLAFLLASDGRDLARAASLAQEAIEEYGEDPSLLDTLGYVYLRQGRARAALTQFQAAANGSPLPHAEFQYHLGLAYSELGRNELAVRAFATALQINPGFTYAEAAKRRIFELRGAGEAPGG